MNINITKRFQTRVKKIVLSLGLIFAQAFAIAINAQTAAPKAPVKNSTKSAATVSSLPKVTQVDAPALVKLLKRDGENAKPLLVNFWATWCDPCREEFPELVKINDDYKGKIDFITVSLDEAELINSDVPKFLLDMKATMPAYLLNTDNEEAAIAAVSKDWQGGLPFTVLINEQGKIVYTRQGKIKPELVRGALDKVLSAEAAK